MNPTSELNSAVLDRFNNLSVLIVGDVMLDEYIWGDADRISPEAPVPVVNIHRRTWGAGGAANAAANIVGLGGRALLGGLIGDDYHGDKLKGILNEAGVDAEGLIKDAGRPTTTKTRILARSQQMVRVDAENRDPIPPAHEDALLEWAESHMRTCGACILSDYNKGALSERVSQGVIQMARRGGKPVVVDPKGVHYAKYRGASVIKPNLHEAVEAIGKPIENEDELLNASRRILDVVGDSALLITRGGDGMSLFQRDEAVRHIPAVARNVYDVTGAGDTVVSVLAMALAAGAPLLDAAHLANRAAGVVVGKIGAAPILLGELRQG
ncbi:MAG: D-glycero-beta-D-manno-heptose-7-phosphate kinase [bacterium]|nr:D-glycero-beta-D-manno-heptose-7-phosphate kinase [bacterium]